MQETMPCIHGPSLCVCMPALVVAVLIAYDYECARKLSASLFFESQKQAFLASWLWRPHCIYKVPENGPSQKEFHLPTIDFKGLLVRFTEGI